MISGMKNSTKVTTWILVVLLIAVAVYFSVRSPGSTSDSVMTGVQTATSTQTVATTTISAAQSVATTLPTRSGWKRYTDAEYGFTFEYPSVWNIETAFIKTDTGTSRIVSVASDASRKQPIAERQEIISVRVTSATTTTIGGPVEYSAARTGFISTTNAQTCVTPSYKVGAAVVDTKVPFYQLMRAHTGDGTRTEDAVLTNKNTLVQVSNVSSYPGNMDVVGVLSSFALTGDVKAVIANCKAGPVAAAPANQGLIIQVTSPVSGQTWTSNSTHVITWRTGTSPVKGNVGLYLVNRVNRKECLLGSAAAQAQSFTVSITANQTCAEGGGLTLWSGDYDFYMKYPYNLMDPFATSTTGALYASPTNTPIHIEIAK